MPAQRGGFFPLSTLMAAKKPLPTVANCQACRLCNTCNTPYMKVSGKGRKGILVVGEAPGEQEDIRGEPFVGPTGRKARETIGKFGLDTVEDIYWTNALICRPPGNKVKNEKSIEYCRPNLIKTINSLKPRVIILMGTRAVKSLIGFLWKEDVGKIGRWSGWRIPSQRYNAWICPTWHPSYLLQQPHPVRGLLFEQHIKEAVTLKGRPWEKVPDYKSEVEVIFDPVKAARAIASYADTRRPVAFDYETNMLKPDTDRSRIVCCSMSDGKRTIAFPWIGRVIEAMKRFFRSKIPKIASNMKFEDRWTNAKVGVPVNNWKLDTMLAAHVLDNRPEITSIKFQAFVNLGQESYDDHIKPFLRAAEPGGYSENRIDEVDKNDLMIYCGLDSLLEWKVAMKQYKELKGEKG